MALCKLALNSFVFLNCRNFKKTGESFIFCISFYTPLTVSGPWQDVGVQPCPVLVISELSSEFAFCPSAFGGSTLSRCLVSSVPQRTYHLFLAAFLFVFYTYGFIVFTVISCFKKLKTFY